MKELLRKVDEDGDRFSLNILVTECLVEPQTFEVNDQQETLLHLACRKNYFHLVRALIEVFCCTLEVKDKLGNSPFHIACENQCLEIVQYFCRYISILPCTHLNANGDTVLHVACKSGSVPLVRLIIHDMFLTHFQAVKLNMYYDDVFSRAFNDNYLHLLGCQPDFTRTENRFGFTPIHYACYYGHYRMLQFFFSEVRSRLNVNLLDLLPSLLSVAYKREHCNGRKIIDYLHTIARDGFNVMLISTRYSAEVIKFSIFNANVNGMYVDPYGHPRSSVVESGLFFAARHANVSLFEYLTNNREISYSHENCNGDTLLHAACVSCNFKMIKVAHGYLSKNYPELLRDQKNNQGDTCLHVACEWGASVEVMDFLLHKGFSINVANEKGQTLLHLAIAHKRKTLFDHLLSKHVTKIDLNAATSDGETPLHLATYNSDLYHYADVIIKHPSFNSLNHPDKYGDTPLFNACRTGDKEMLSLLTNLKECNLLIVNQKTNETIFNIACRMNEAKLLDFLFESLLCTYPPKLQNYLGQTLLHIACMQENLDMVKCLAKWDQNYSFSSDINLIDKMNELTLLQYACTKNDVTLVKDLLDRGSNPNLKNNQEDSVLHICCKKNLWKIANFIQEHCSLTVRNCLGDTPLHVACKHGNFDLALNLLKNMPNNSVFDCFNKEGDSLLHTAATRKGAIDVLKYVVGKRICSYDIKNKNNGNTALHEVCQSERSFVMENAVFLLKQNYSRESWYNEKMESPLYLAASKGHFKFIFSVVAESLVETWHLESCVQMESPFRGHHAINLERVDMPLPHYLIYSSL